MSRHLPKDSQYRGTFAHKKISEWQNLSSVDVASYRQRLFRWQSAI